jgi:hypothetical protein
MSACKHRVSGSLSLPSRGPFHLSLTVLYAIGHQDVFSLRRWSSHVPTRLHVSCGTLDARLIKIDFAYKTITLFRPIFQLCSAINFFHYAGPNPAAINCCGLGSFPFAHHYLGNRIFSFSSSGYLDVSVLRVPFVRPILFRRRYCGTTRSELPHSEIRGSKLIYSSPRLIAVSHVLHRRLVPRHPPYALISFNHILSYTN